MLVGSFAALGIAGAVITSMAEPAADGPAGQKIFDSTCAACHQPRSYAGKSKAELRTELKGIVAGTIGQSR